MPTFFTFDGISIHIYFRDHLPPHFHATYAEHEILMVIEDLSIYRGDLPPKQMKKLKKWAKEHQSLLQEIWDETRTDEQ